MPNIQGAFKLDTWQEEVLSYKGNIAIRSGRQVGKSTVIAMKAAQFAKDHPGTTTLIIAASQRQSALLFEKVRGEFDNEKDKGQDWYAEEPTLTKIVLTNGSKVYSLPAGKTGYFIRGFSIDLLIADEAAYIPETVWQSVKPMIAVAQNKGLGWIILLSTPFGKGGYFYECCHDSDFKQFHVSSESCSRIPKEYLRKEKEKISKQEYAQEYLGEFIDDFMQFFPTELIKNCMTFIDWDYKKDYDFHKAYYLGVDIARYGGDENAFVIAEMDEKGNLKIVKAETTERKSITDTVGRILRLHELFRFKRIFIDDAGVGGGATDMLIDKLGRRIVGLNNASKRVQVQGEEKKKGILKEDLYSNALVLMEKASEKVKLEKLAKERNEEIKLEKEIELISDLSLLRSLKSITIEYSADKHLKLSGDYSHLCEAFVRACWCKKEKGLKLFLA